MFSKIAQPVVLSKIVHPNKYTCVCVCTYMFTWFTLVAREDGLPSVHSEETSIHSNDRHNRDNVIKEKHVILINEVNN